MRKLLLFLVLLLLFSVPVTLSAQCTSAPPSMGYYAGLDGPAQYFVSLPSPATCYNGQMIFFAHGFVPAGSPSGAWLAQLNLPDGSSLPALVNSLGFGFAASSYSKDGLATPEGVYDTVGLVNVLQQQLGIPVQRYFVTGASEGGPIAVKALETYPFLSGGVSVCGPIGSFQQEINYLGDVRVLFDYFFPGVLATGTPGESAIKIPLVLQLNWPTVSGNVLKALAANPLATLQLVFVAHIPVGLNFSNAGEAVLGALFDNVFGANDAAATLKGNAYDNLTRVYHGSFNDARLNALVARFSKGAVDLGPYETTGALHDPLVTLHTIADPLVPFGQEALYAAKVQAHNSSAELTQIPSLNYGHCNVTKSEASYALLLMLLKAGL
jgi:hypothetical protein